MKLNDLTYAINSAAMEVHRLLGPGLLESAYEECLAREFTVRNIPFERQYPLPVEYKGIRLESADTGWIFLSRNPLLWK